MNPKALIAMSGGVDSAVAALLMKQAGYDCVGCTMRLHGGEQSCCTSSDVEDARRVAASLGMPHEVCDFSDDFREKIVDRFIRAYESGVTPNPCIECNRYMKFDRLFGRAEECGCDLVVTGHYVRVEKRGDRFVLRKAVDEAKDQSYFLYTLTQSRLARVAFPLGGMHKADVRAIAEQNGFVNAEKPDSQDICFVPDGDYAAVIERLTGRKSLPGNFVSSDGEVLGRHRGIIHYTVGQRKGLGIASATPLYVLAVSPEDNTVVLGQENELFSTRVGVKEVHWISGEAPTAPIRCSVKIRYRHKEQPAVLTPTDGGATVIFDEPQRAVTPGQAAVFYDGDVVLGGGVITRN